MMFDLSKQVATPADSGDATRSRRSVAVPFLSRPVQLGDAVQRIARALHLPHCGGCEQRRQTLNQLVQLTPRGTR